MYLNIQMATVPFVTGTFSFIFTKSVLKIFYPGKHYSVMLRASRFCLIGLHNSDQNRRDCCVFKQNPETLSQLFKWVKFSIIQIFHKNDSNHIQIKLWGFRISGPEGNCGLWRMLPSLPD